MRSFVRPTWLAVLGLLAPAAVVCTPFTPTLAHADAKPPAGQPRQVSFLREVRPILAQHCFQCHGPDEAARKGKLRLDRKDATLAARRGKHVVAPGNLAGSLVWDRVTTDDAEAKMPPEGELTEKERATLKTWIEQGAKWEEHWSLVTPAKPPVPSVFNPKWVRDPLDAFVLARLDREGLRPSAEATREAWLRRASFDLTGLPPTPAEVDAFVNDKSADAFEKQADRLLASTRYGERQAQEWLDLARYADTNGYQNDTARQIWKWREWVVNAYNANLPFDRFVTEQLAGDLLPNATVAQRVATGFNRNHPTNSEAGEEEDEYRSVYVIDRVNTTATVFMGLTMACAQCHDHKYDPISQKDYYSFYSFFNNIKERDADFTNPRPVMPVPTPDQEPRLADFKARVAALQQRLDRDDPVADAAQREWEKKAVARIGGPVAWTTPTPTAVQSRNGAVLTRLGDGSILSGGVPPVRDVYEVMLLPGKKRITALRLEVLPDDSHPGRASGRAADGRFSLSAIEIRHASLSDSSDPPLVYVSKAEADLNQKVKEERAVFDMVPGAVDTAVVVDPVGMGEGGRGRGGWSIVGDERRRPHEAVFLPLEPIETNDASVLRVVLHQTGGRFKSLIGRFRVSYTEDDRVREVLLPAQTKLWSSIGPFPAEDDSRAFTTAFEVEKDITTRDPLDLKKSYTKPKPPTPEAKTDDATAPPPKAKFGKFGGKSADAKPADGKPAEKKDEVPPIPKATDDPAPPKKDEKDPATAKKAEPKAEKIAWTEQAKWRDGQPSRLSSGSGAYYLTRKIVSTQPRTATIRLDGVAGFKVWVNGEPAEAVAPPPPVAPPPTPKKKETKSDDEDGPPDFDVENLDFEAIMSGRVRSTTEKRFRVGLRQGENEVVVKMILGSGSPRGPRGFGGPAGVPSGSFTFHFTPEGDDVLTHEVATALRLEQVQSDTTGPAVAPAPRPVPVLSSLKDGPRKVGIAGEKAAAPRDDEDDALTPHERRRKVLRDHFRASIDPVGRVVSEELTKLKDEEREFKRRLPQTLVMEELDAPRQAYIFLRGLYKARGENVDPGTPSVLPPMPSDQPRNRLGLAKWLVSADHPLTGRVLANRIWQQYFGLGLVRTAEDFGIRGEVPTHPELLDYLATELARGWDLKKFHRRVVLSATYRQSSVSTPEALERDPENRLFARAPRLRMTAEMVRDNALAVSGLLVEKVGGESVKPVQPKDAWKGVDGFGGGYRRDRDEKQYRRALYVFWKRGAPYPSMLNFDACKRDGSVVTRATTTTPLQALTLLNDPVYVECAKMLGDRMRKDKDAIGRARDLSRAAEDAKRLAYGFRLCTSRTASEKEVGILKSLLDDQRAHFKADADAAKKLLAVGDAKADAADPAEAAAWAAVGSALLNLDATIHR